MDMINVISEMHQQQNGRKILNELLLFAYQFW